MSYDSAVVNGQTDEALLVAAARRDEHAVAILYDRYGGLAYGLAYRILNDRSAAEDVVQEAFLSIWRRAASFEVKRGSARTWLLSIVHHRAIDRLRGTSGRDRQGASLDEVDRIVAVDDPWRDVELTLQRETLRRGLASLPEEQRRTIELAYFGGYTQTEIANAMGVPLGTVKGRIRMGLQKLRALLAAASVEHG